MPKPDPRRFLPRLPSIPPLTDEEKRRSAEAEVKLQERENGRPCYGQTREATKVWMKQHAAPGVIVVARSTIGNVGGDYDYMLDEVTDLHESKRFFYTRHAFAWNSMGYGRYYYSGQSHDTPTGQVDLLIPTPAVVRAAIHGPRSMLAPKPDPALVERAVEQTKRLFGGDVVGSAG